MATVMVDEGQLRNAGGGGDWATAAIQTGAALYDSAQDRKTSKRNVDATIAANKSESELAYQRSIEQRDYMNRYNSPEAQMQRFIDAGLNPHLIYGQGSGGQQQSAPQYSPPDIQYKYAHGNFGQAIGGFLPTLMSVGTWLQNMRASEAQIRKTESDTTRIEQLVDQLTRVNPVALQKLKGQAELLPGQKVLQDVQRDKGIQALRELETEFRQKYGDDLWEAMGSSFDIIGGNGKLPAIGGTKGLEFLQEKQKLLQAESKTKLMGAQASWADFDITNPQQIMLMVLNGVLGLAGGAMKLPGRAKGTPAKSPQTGKPRQRPRGLVRRRMSSNHPDR